MKSEACNTNVDTGDELLARSLDAAGPHEETRTSTETNNTIIFAHEVRIEMRLTVGV